MILMVRVNFCVVEIGEEREHQIFTSRTDEESIQGPENR